ncbi:hypothetical protein FJP65_16165 [Stenotrophomonas maltophilia]|jgi:hypothetical protein|nr:hypothetical protein FJP65_16165 [Stenotrophomonas maltophilia]
MKSTIRCSQRDFSLAFKLSVVELVERGELTYKKQRIAMESKSEANHFSSFAGMPGKMGQLGHRSFP